MFSKWMEKGICYPSWWKGDKQIIKSYWPVSLLCICCKIFEKIIFNSLFKYLEDNKLLNCNQSDFWSVDSCVDQLLSITQNLQIIWCQSLSLEVRGVFLDISKAFDPVWPS